MAGNKCFYLLRNQANLIPDGNTGRMISVLCGCILYLCGPYVAVITLWMYSNSLAVVYLSRKSLYGLAIA